MAGLTKEQRAQREAAKMTEANTQELKQDEVKLVDMVRSEEAYPAPHTATVHPDEVVNYQLGGWVVKPEEKA